MSLWTYLRPGSHGNVQNSVSYPINSSNTGFLVEQQLHYFQVAVTNSSEQGRISFLIISNIRPDLIGLQK